MSQRASLIRSERPEGAGLALLIVAVLLMGLLVVVPLIAVLSMAFAKGLAPFFAAISHPDAIAAMKLTGITALIAVPLNAVFGVAAAWAITKFEFRGKSL